MRKQQFLAECANFNLKTYVFKLKFAGKQEGVVWRVIRNIPNFKVWR